MSEKRFTIHKENMYKEDWYDYPFCIKEDGEVVLETIPLFIAEKVRDKLNEQQATIQFLQNEIDELKKDIDIYKYEEKKHSETARKLYEENEQLKEQVQILNKCCRHKSSDEYIKQAYADLNRREREKHSQGNATYIAKINQNELIY